MIGTPMEMTWNEFKHCINADLYRYESGLGWHQWLHAWRFKPGLAVGIPAPIISTKGTAGYVTNTTDEMPSPSRS